GEEPTRALARGAGRTRTGASVDHRILRVPGTANLGRSPPTRSGSPVRAVVACPVDYREHLKLTERFAPSSAPSEGITIAGLSGGGGFGGGGAAPAPRAGRSRRGSHRSA